MRVKNYWAIWLIRVSIIIGAVCCFIVAARFFDRGLPYVAETSSSPTPSETARILGPQMMKTAQKWFYIGLAFVAALIGTLFIKKKHF
jgi:hypothetical protein